MSIDEGDKIVAVQQVPDEADQLYLLAASGMMIRIKASQTKETTGRVTKGTRLMELRDRDKSGKRLESFSDAVIGVARMPAWLTDEQEGDPDEEE
jgi:DNA gyrase/topoisomerase IV subunit A